MVFDMKSGISKIKVNYKKQNEETYRTEEIEYKEMNGKEKGTTGTQTEELTLQNLEKGTYNPETANYNETVEISNPTRAGYEFAGWTASNLSTGTAYYGTSSDSVTTAWDNAETTPTEIYFENLRNTNESTISLTANWRPISYTISYEMNSGTKGTNAPISANYNSTITIDNPIKTGYTFTGWTISGMDSCEHIYGNSTGMETTLSSIKDTTFKNLRQTTGAVVFTAIWTVNTYTLTLNPKQGTYNGTTENSTKLMTYDSNNNNSIGIPTRNQYVFTGWYTAESGGTQVYNASGQNVYAPNYWTAAYSNGTWKYPEDITLYAQWKKAAPVVTITYNNWLSAVYINGTKVSSGWSGEISAGSQVMLEGDSVYARWGNDSWTRTFGSGDVAVCTVPETSGTTSSLYIRGDYMGNGNTYYYITMSGVCESWTFSAYCR